MGFLENIVSSAVKAVVLAPIAVIKDAADTVVGSEPAENTKKMVSSALDDLEEAGNDLAEGEML